MADTPAAETASPGRGPVRRRPPRKTVRNDDTEKTNVLLDVDHTPPVANVPPPADPPPDEQTPPAPEPEIVVEVRTETVYIDPLDPSKIPFPIKAEAADGPLTLLETEALAVCEAAVGRLQLAFWAAGRALQVIRDGRLYREVRDAEGNVIRPGFATFDDYLEQQWEMSRQQATRLIQAWPIAERIGNRPRLNERQVRGLLPVADAHGKNAAVLVYDVIAETEGVRISGGIIEGAVKALPEGDWNEEAAVNALRAYLAGDLEPETGEEEETSVGSRAATVFNAEMTRLKTSAHRVAKVATVDPGRAREFAEELANLRKEILDAIG